MQTALALLTATVAGLALSALGAAPVLEPLPGVAQVVAIVAAGPVLGLALRVWWRGAIAHAIICFVAMNAVLIFDPPDTGGWGTLGYVVLANLTALMLWALGTPLLIAAWSFRAARAARAARMM
jgi:hypothetical protein